MSDTEDWINTLAGKADGHKDAMAVRDALVEADTAARKQVPPEDDLAFIAIMSRLEREGLLDSEHPEKSPSWWWSLSAAAMLVLAVAVGLIVDNRFDMALEPQLSANFDDAPRFRGELPVQEMSARDSHWLQQVLERLQARNWPYKLSAAGESHWRLSFYVPGEATPEQREWLKGEGIALPVNGWVVLQVKQ